MTDTVATLNYLFALGTLGLLAIVVATLAWRATTGYLLPRPLAPYVEPYLLWAIAALGVVSSALSLWYSEVVGFPPCALCWFARTMMYPIAIIGTVAAWRKDASVWPYLFTLAIIGMMITGYHHLYQVGYVEGTLCNALADGGDCAKRYVYEFGFVTFPFMGFVVFSVMALLSWLMRGHKQ